MSMLSEHLEDEQTVALTRGSLPRVNLLPLEIGERVRFRRIQYGLGLGVLGALGVAVLLYALASGSVADAERGADCLQQHRFRAAGRDREVLRGQGGVRAGSGS